MAERDRFHDRRGAHPKYRSRGANAPRSDHAMKIRLLLNDHNRQRIAAGQVLRRDNYKDSNFRGYLWRQCHDRTATRLGLRLAKAHWNLQCCHPEEISRLIPSGPHGNSFISLARIIHEARKDVLAGVI